VCTVSEGMREETKGEEASGPMTASPRNPRSRDEEKPFFPLQDRSAAGI